MEVDIHDQPEKLPNDERTIDWTGSPIDKYATARHVQWVEETHNETHLKSMTGYIKALWYQFGDMEARDEAYASVEKVRYNGCSQDIST